MRIIPREQAEKMDEEARARAKIEPLPTTFFKSEVLAALKGCGYYDHAFSIYQQSVELQLFWATYLEIDINHAATQAVIQQLGLTQEVIDELRQWVVEARKHEIITASPTQATNTNS